MSDRSRHRRKWLNCFIAHRLEMLLAPAWRNAPVPLRRILERLEIEYLRHGARNNGALYVAFSQFVSVGVSRRTIRPMLDLGMALGLMEVVRSQDALGDLRAPNAYRLTYVPAMTASLPTDEWRSISEERAVALVAQVRGGDEKKNRPHRARQAA
jgi:hypothetical protein